MSEVPTVWILGAGFSRSLGGPLLVDLLSMAGWSEYEVHERTSNLDLEHHRSLIQGLALYHFGRRFPDGYFLDPTVSTPSGAQWWDHAEHFLEALSATNQEKLLEARWIAVHSSLNPRDRRSGIDVSEYAALNELNLPLIRQSIAKFVAWQCDFVPRARPEGDDWERSGPYVDWGKLLGPNDTVISFNYDTVVEEVARPTIHVRLPEDTSETVGPELLKLHGSVDWRKDEAGAHLRSRDAGAPVIATPGNAKLSMKSGGLKPLWDRAERKLSEAKVVHWLGYSMPASDTSAAHSLLGSLSRNTSELLHIFLVLGEAGFHTKRLSRMLSAATRTPSEDVLQKKLRKAREIREQLRGQRVLSTLAIAELARKVERLSPRKSVNTALLSHACETTEVVELFAQDYLREASLKSQDPPGMRPLIRELRKVLKEIDYLQSAD